MVMSGNRERCFDAEQVPSIFQYEWKRACWLVRSFELDYRLEPSEKNRRCLEFAKEKVRKLRIAIEDYAKERETKDDEY